MVMRVYALYLRSRVALAILVAPLILTAGAAFVSIPYSKGNCERDLYFLNI